MRQLRERSIQPVTLAIDNGGTNTRVLVRQGTSVRMQKFPTGDSYGAFLEELDQASAKLLGGRKPDAVGVSVAGEVSPTGTTLVKAGDLNAKGFVGEPYASDVATATGLRSHDNIVVFNDCVAGAYTESLLNPLPHADGAYFTFSTGLGGALYTPEGLLVPDEPGHRDLGIEGGQCGCGSTTCIEGHIGGGAIARKYSRPAQEIPHDDPAWREIKDNFHNGMFGIFADYREAGLNVEQIAFAGSVARGGPRMLSDLGVHFAIPLGEAAPTIGVAQYGDDSPLVGAERAAEALVKGKTLPQVVYEGVTAVRNLR